MILRALDDVHNKIVRNAAHVLRSQEARERSGQTVLEGPHLVWEAVEAKVRIRAVLYSNRLMQRPDGQDLFRRVTGGLVRSVYVTDRVLDHVTMVDNHQGVVALVELVVDSLDRIEEGPVLLVDGVQDPGNLGALIRAATAFGFVVALGPGTVDPLNPKVLRASAGAFFRRPPYRLTADWSLGPGLALAVADATGGTPYRMWTWPEDVVLAVGSEGTGVSPGVRERAEAVVSIPMQDGVESLNVAVAAGILMAEAHGRRPLRG